jgi:hypothetical protein
MIAVTRAVLYRPVNKRLITVIESQSAVDSADLRFRVGHSSISATAVVQQLQSGFGPFFAGGEQNQQRCAQGLIKANSILSCCGRKSPLSQIGELPRIAVGSLPNPTAESRWFRIKIPKVPVLQ